MLSVKVKYWFCHRKALETDPGANGSIGCATTIHGHYTHVQCTMCIKLYGKKQTSTNWRTNDLRPGSRQIATELVWLQRFITSSNFNLAHWTVGVWFPPFCLRLFQQASHLLTYNFRIPNKYFLFAKKNSLTPLKTPLSLKKWIFKLLWLPCCWYSKRVSWDAGHSWKGISLIRLLSTEKRYKTFQNINNCQIKQKYGSNRFFFMSDQRLMAEI